MRVPGVAGLRLDMGEAGAGRRAGDSDEVIASRTLNLPAREAGVTFQRLVALRAVEFEFVHGLHLYMRKPIAKSMWRNGNTFGPPFAHVEVDEQFSHAFAPGT